ncbi:MAG: hypothetical protein M5U26_15940 [Planctomycetota bacterium]|nr:hypothetical protein [Planctomycetota bacterium]
MSFSDRTWPPPFYEREGVKRDPEHRDGWGLQNRSFVFVQEGGFAAMPLAFPGQSLAIPANEAYVTALDSDPRDVVFGGTGGTRAHLFAALTRGITGAVIDLATLEDNARVTAVLCGSDRKVYAVTAPGGSQPIFDPRRYEQPGEGALYVHASVDDGCDLIHEWSFPPTPAQKLATPLPGEGIACAVRVPLGKREDLLVGLGERTGTLFTCTLPSGEVHVVGPVSSIRRFGRALALGTDGLVYGTGTEGRFWRFDPAARKLEHTDLYVPGLTGRAYHNDAECLAVDRARGVLYGAGAGDGVLFAYDLRAGTLRSLGKPTCYRGVRGLAVTRDGRLFGFSGREGDVGRLFLLRPRTPRTEGPRRAGGDVRHAHLRLRILLRRHRARRTDLLRPARTRRPRLDLLARDPPAARTRRTLSTVRPTAAAPARAGS